MSIDMTIDLKGISYLQPFREGTIIRSASTGEILERLPGDIHIMPNGDLWHLW